MKKNKLFSNRNQISILSKYEKELKAICKERKVTLKEIAVSNNHTVYEYCNIGDRKEFLLYEIKAIYERELVLAVTPKRKN